MEYEFWKDRWCSDSLLRESFLALFSMATAKNPWVVEVWEEAKKKGFSNTYFSRQIGSLMGWNLFAGDCKCR